MSLVSKECALSASWLKTICFLEIPQGREVEEAESIPYSVLTAAIAEGLTGVTREALGYLMPIKMSRHSESR